MSVTGRFVGIATVTSVQVITPRNGDLFSRFAVEVFLGRFGLGLSFETVTMLRRAVDGVEL